MSGFDEGRVFWSDQRLPEQNNANVPRKVMEKKFVEFIRSFHLQGNFVYREMLRSNTNMREFKLEVKVEDLRKFDNSLPDKIFSAPADWMNAFEKAATDVFESGVAGQQEENRSTPTVQIILIPEHDTPRGMRDLEAEDFSKIVHLKGIIVAASKPKIKATSMTLQCKNCRTLKYLSIRPGMGRSQIPRVCDRPPSDVADKCELDPYVVLAEKSQYVDQQTLKMQELPEQIPTSEMPRHMTLTLDRHLVGKVQPGAVVSVMGIFGAIDESGRSRPTGQRASVGVQVPYLKVVGICELSGAGGRMTDTDFSTEEECLFRNMASEPDFPAKLARSIAPSIFGHENIKKALACQLVGGSRKRLPDGARLRGDINVLMLGDPSTAKSQLLKFIEKAAPISVYTSGKGSSAAGLTASVIKDSNTGEFFLEGGAMVLADGGVVCIDEFDKMRPEDRVAIHEAMEQQTISVAKAGITTVLNTRTSVLAAANPTFGRYDDMKSAVENIDFQSTILSRFDLIFIIRDVRNEERDQRIAKHVVALHRQESQVTSEGEIELETIKKYVCYARHKCSPRLSDAAAKRLQEEYIRIRQRYGQDNADGAPAIPITVRQLEAIIRISESLAKMTLSNVATEQHVEEAVQLFKESTEDAASRGLMVEGMANPALMADVLKAERAIKERVGIGMSVPERALVSELRERGLPEAAVRKAMSVMLQRQELELRSQGRYVCRQR